MGDKAEFPGGGPDLTEAYKDKKDYREVGVRKKRNDDGKKSEVETMKSHRPRAEVDTTTTNVMVMVMVTMGVVVCVPRQYAGGVGQV